MCVCVCVCVYVFVHVCVCVCVFVHVNVNVCVCVCLYVAYMHIGYIANILTLLRKPLGPLYSLYIHSYVGLGLKQFVP